VYRGACHLNDASGVEEHVERTLGSDARIELPQTSRASFAIDVDLLALLAQEAIHPFESLMGINTSPRTSTTAADVLSARAAPSVPSTRSP